MKLLSSIKSIFARPDEVVNDRIDEKLTNPLVFHKFVPDKLGIHTTVPGLIEIVNHLEAALDPTYITKVKERYRNIHKVSDQEYEWTLLEMKRVFILSGILKNNFYYSENVDNLWRTMIMFENDYETFCMSFRGAYIPYLPKASEQQRTWSSGENRALFDLTYSMLFTIYPANEQLQDLFFRFKANEEVFLTIEKYPNSFFINQYFNKGAGPSFTEIQEEIINEIRSNYLEAKSAIKAGKDLPGQPASLNRFLQRTSDFNKDTVTIDSSIHPITSILLLSSLYDASFTHIRAEIEEGDMVINNKTISSYRVSPKG